MRTVRAVVQVLCNAVLALTAAAQQPGSIREVVGEWYGRAAIEVDAGLPVSVVLRVIDDGGGLRALLTLPESRQTDLELPSPYSDSAKVTYDRGRLRLEFTPDIGFGFLQNLGVPIENQRIVLDVARAGAALRGSLSLNGHTGAITLRPGRPSLGYREQDVVFASAHDGLRLHGTLIRPLTGIRHPVAIFITGSDPDTRTRWKFEAGALAGRGVASLLYDKRGVGESVGASHDLASWDDLADDVEGAVEYLRTRTDVIDTAHIGLIGQSQGTWMIAKVASRNPHVAFAANISGGGMSGAEQETYRTGALMRRAGSSDTAIARAVAFQRQKFAVARTGLGWEALDSVMQQLRRDSVPWFPGFGTGAAARTLATLRLYGVLQFNYDPRPDLQRIRVPTLVLLGVDDVVFPPDTVAERVRTAMAANPDVTITILPGTGHGMLVRQTAGGRPFRWVIYPRFVEELSNWVASRAVQQPVR
jgi:pimeloyl-ACP methyl ester carboxylesterase